LRPAFSDFSTRTASRPDDVENGLLVSEFSTRPAPRPDGVEIDPGRDIAARSG